MIIENPKDELPYITIDGAEFFNKFDALAHERLISRQSYYEHLLKNRNWFQRLFNIKPNMDFYDSHNV